MSPTRPFDYQPALDGLRAIAVAGVMAYHADRSWLPGGFLGVDVFFVLSGYLITSLLWNELREDGSLRMPAFWGRRLRRLFPALLVVLVAVAIQGALLLEPSQRTRLRADGLAALFYVSNWRFILEEQSYFDHFAAPSPLLHTWSLGIEEQWYLLWPIVLWVLHRATRGSERRLLLCAALAAAASAAWMAWLYAPGQDPSRVYYGTDTRAQNLLVGSALAFALPRAQLLGSAARLIAPLGGAGALALATLMLGASDHATWLYRGGLLSCAVATAAVIAAAVQPGGCLRGVLSLPPLRFVGRISYGMYLWHWPLYLVLEPGRTGIEGLPLLTLRVAATLAVSILSFYALESPIRRGAMRGLRIRVLAGASIPATAALLLVTTRPPAEVSIADRAPAETLEAKDRLRIVVLGDSVAHTLASAFPKASHGRTLEVVNLATLGCGVGVGQYAYGSGVFSSSVECARWPERWRNAEQLEPDAVLVLVGAWEVVDRMIGQRRYVVRSRDYARYLRREIARGLEPFLARRTPVVFLTTPCFQQRWSAMTPTRPAPQQERSEPERVVWLNRVIGAFAAAHPGQVTLLDLHAYSCAEGGRPGTIEGVELQPDGVHFSPKGGRVVWRWLLERLPLEGTGHHVAGLRDEQRAP